MTSIRDVKRIVLGLALASTGAVSACGLARPPDPPPFDCAAIDRASERFPDECPAASPDAGVGDGGAP